MSQENIQTDTPQESTNEQQYSSLEEAVFGNTNEGSGSVESAFTSGNEGSEEVAAPETGQPAQETIKPVVDNNNDETRYQYWQSQADKYKNELESLKNTQPAPVQPEAPAVDTDADEFPSAPSKPQKPRLYSREEAYTDPASESARYDDELSQWRDDMNEYNSLRTQYQSAMLEEKFNKLESDRVEAAKKQEAAAAEAQQQNEIRSHIMGHHGMSESEANDFMTKMSDPNSITVDNLVQLYRMLSLIHI